MTQTKQAVRRRVLPFVGALAFVPFMFLALGAAAMAPQTVVDSSYTTLANWQSWTYTGSFHASSTGVGTAPSADTGNPAVLNDTATSPAMTYIPSNDSMVITYNQVDSGSPGPATVYLSVSWDGGAYTQPGKTCTAGACTSNAFTAPSAGSYHTLVVQFIVHTAGGWSSFDHLTVTDNTATALYNPGTWTAPTLDLNALSTQMVDFWDFMAPAVYIIAGISLGGLIVSKVRNLI